MIPTEDEIDKKEEPKKDYTRKILLKKRTKLSVEDRLKDMLGDENTKDT